MLASIKNNVDADLCKQVFVDFELMLLRKFSTALPRFSWRIVFERVIDPDTESAPTVDKILKHVNVQSFVEMILIFRIVRVAARG